jgi:hypothetical protein
MEKQPKNLTNRLLTMDLTQSEIDIAIRALQDMIRWSDRIGSDEIAELDYVVKLLKKES